MQRTSIATALLATLSIALLAATAPASARLVVPIDGASYAEPAPVVEFHHAAKNLFFVTSDLAPRVHALEVLADTAASDHQPVVIELA